MTSRLVSVTPQTTTITVSSYLLSTYYLVLLGLGPSFTLKSVDSTSKGIRTQVTGQPAALVRNGLQKQSRAREGIFVYSQAWVKKFG